MGVERTKLTLEKKILPLLLPGFELATFRSRVRRSNQQAIPDVYHTPFLSLSLSLSVLSSSLSVYNTVLYHCGFTSRFLITNDLNHILCHIATYLYHRPSCKATGRSLFHYHLRFISHTVLSLSVYINTILNLFKFMSRLVVCHQAYRLI